MTFSGGLSAFVLHNLCVNLCLSVCASVLVCLPEQNQTKVLGEEKSLYLVYAKKKKLV